MPLSPHRYSPAHTHTHTAWFGRVLFSALLIAAGVFVFADQAFAYASGGLLVSKNMLSDEAAARRIISVTYNASAIPANTQLRLQFSNTGTGYALWFNSSGERYGWDTLSAGTHTIGLSGRHWFGQTFYYRALFTSSGAATPVFDSIQVNFDNAVGVYVTYNSTGSLVSANMLPAVSVDNLDSFGATVSVLPPQTNLKIQFGQNSTAWYNAAGSLNGSNILAEGSNVINLRNIGWAGSGFYYRINFTSSGSDTAVVDDVTLTIGTGRGTVQYIGTGSQTGLSLGNSYYNLEFNGMGGTWSLTSGLTLSGSLTMRAGTLAQSGALVTASGGLILQGGAFRGGTGSLRVARNVTLTGGTLIAPTGTFTVSGSWLKKAAATFTSGSGTVTLNGANQTLSGSTTFWNLTKSVTTARTLTFAAGTTQTVAGTLTLNGAASNLLSLRSSQTGNQWKIAPIRTRTIGYVDVKDSNNTNATVVSCSDNCVSSGNNTNWEFPWAGIVYTNEGSTIIGAGKTVAVSVNGGAATTGTTNSNGKFAIVKAASAGDVVAIWLDNATEDAALVTVTDGLSFGSHDLYQNRLILKHQNGGSLTNANLATAAVLGDTDLTGMYSLAGSALTVASNTELFVWASNTFAPGGAVYAGSGADINGTLTLAGNPITLSGALDLTGGTMTTSGLVTLDGTGPVTLTSNSQSFQNLTIGGNGGRVTLADALDVNGALLISTGATLRAVGKTMDITGGSFSNHGVLALNSTETLTGFTNDGDSGTVRFIGSGNYVSLANLTQFSALTFSGAGTWNLKKNILAGSGVTVTTGTVTGTGGLTLSGSLIATGGGYRGTGTVILDGAGTINISRALSGAILNAAGTYTLANPLSVSGSLILRSGTLDVSTSNHAITLATSWEKESNATFTGRSGSVILGKPRSGTGQTLSGSTVFWNLTKQNGSGHTLFFGAGATQTVGGTWTALGTSARNLKLLSVTSGTQWKIDPKRTRTLQYVTPKDSNNINATSVLCSNDCTNGGNNSSWAFPLAVTVYSNSGTTLMGAGKTVAVAVNGNVATKMTAVTNSAGVATITGIGLSAGDIVTIWLDNGTEKGVTITKTNGTTLAFDLFTNVVQVQAEQGSVITSRNVGTGASISDADISSLITIGTSGTGVTIDMPDSSHYDVFRINSGDTFQLSGAMTGATLDMNGTFQMGSYNVLVIGNWDATGGAFNGSNTVTFETDRQRKITSNGSAFGSVEFRIPSIGALGQWFIADGITVSTSSTITITAGSTNVNGPNISNVSATAYDERARIAWTTDILADSKVIYGTNSGSLTSAVSSGADVLSHSLAITGLTKATTYWFKVISQDTSNKYATGSLLSFNTLPLAADAPVISDTAVTANETTATVSWTTNKAANSHVAYGTTSGSLKSSVSSVSTALSHSLSLAGLSRGTRYYFRVASTAANGRTGTGSQMSFLTLGYTQTELDAAQSTARAAGVTEGIGSTTEVRQGGGGGGRRQIVVQQCLLPEEKAPADILKNIRRLLPQRIAGVFDGLLAAANVKELAAAFEKLVPFLRKGSTGPALGGAPRVDVDGTTATVFWATLEPGNSFVEYTPDARYTLEGYDQTVGNPDAETRDHTVVLKDLAPGTVYHYRVRSGNRLLASSFSDDFTFAIPGAPGTGAGAEPALPEHAAAPEAFQPVAAGTGAVEGAVPGAALPSPFVINNYRSAVLSPTTARFSWETSLPTTTRVTVTPYGADGVPLVAKTRTVAHEARTVAHTVPVTRFDPGVLYAVQIGGTDAAGREVLRIDPEFATDPKRSPAQIAEVTTDAFLTPEQKDAVVVVIAWTTTKETVGLVRYREGVTEDPEEVVPFVNAEEASFGRTHSAMLRGLSPGTVYSFRIEVRDARGTSFTSNTFTLLTPKEEEGIFRIILTQFEEVFGWLRIFTTDT